ncbi:YozQ family protein [Bacillus sp. JCM 19034]|uniref:YozQ family protein n=1 Tax=Bacillus sp. JCM 19034 TaxID=1481928 RepID=UPI001E36B509|nr:YozQ family protein [Bacillus sp. JCM 19034]
MDKVDKRAVENVSTKTYQPSHYKSNNDSEKGLALTHEQVSDTFTEGTIEYKKERNK